MSPAPEAGSTDDFRTHPNAYELQEIHMIRSPRTAALKALVGGFALAMAAGCATTAQLEEVRAEAQEAKRIAAEATARLEAAQSSIQQAMQMARAAQAAADASQNCCTDLERKLDRALEDMQRK
jgi:hypothetical protein